MKKDHFYKGVSLEFLVDLASLLADASEAGATSMTFTLPKTPTTEKLRDVEVTISWRMKG